METESSSLLPHSNAHTSILSISFLTQVAPVLGCWVIFAPSYAFQYDVDLFTTQLRDSVGWTSVTDSWFAVVVVLSISISFLPAYSIPKFGIVATLWIASLLNVIGFCLFYIGSTTSTSFLIFFAAIFIGQSSAWVTLIVQTVVGRNTKAGPSLSLAFALLEMALPFGADVFAIIVDIVGGANKYFTLCTGLTISAIFLFLSPIVQFLPEGTSKLDLDTSSSWAFIISVITVTAALLIIFECTTGSAETSVSYMVVSFYALCLGSALFLVLQGLTRDSGIRKYFGELCNFSPAKQLEKVGNDGVPFEIVVYQARFWVIYAYWACLYGVGIGIYLSMEDILKSGLDSNTDGATVNSLVTKCLVAFNGGSMGALVFVGFASDLVSKFADRIMLICLIISSASLFWLSFIDLGSFDSLVGPLILIGGTFGIAFPLVPIILLNWYGDQDFEKIQGLIDSCCAVGVLVLYLAVLDWMFIDAKHDNNGLSSCSACFKPGFRVQASICLFVGLVGSFVSLKYDSSV